MCALRRIAIAAIASLLWACPASPSKPPKAPEPDPGVAPKPEPAQEGVPYDCAGLMISVDECAERTPQWVTALHHLGNELFESRGGGPTAQSCAAAHGALDSALRADASTLIPEERIAAQNGALRLYGPQNCDRHQPGLAAKAKRVVARLAPSVAATSSG